MQHVKRPFSLLHLQDLRETSWPCDELTVLRHYHQCCSTLDGSGGKCGVNYSFFSYSYHSSKVSHNLILLLHAHILVTAKVNLNHACTGGQGSCREMWSPWHGRAPDPEAERHEQTYRDGSCRRRWESEGVWRQRRAPRPSQRRRRRPHLPTTKRNLPSEGGSCRRPDCNWPADGGTNQASDTAGSSSATPAPANHNKWVNGNKGIAPHHRHWHIVTKS